MNIYSLKKALKVLKVKNIFRLSIIPLHRDINNDYLSIFYLCLSKGIFLKDGKGKEVYFLYWDQVIFEVFGILPFNF